MRLKSLEIKGFKSFADKTVVRFDEGITGIIGPNGCGKSNIIDSIRWVIGEQKISALRSENLEALVFNGSKTRSASGLAEVSLTFENNRQLLPIEFTTVTITRRFYKNGDSEYRLNDVNCRLKDIHNLFMDTGISTDSYAIIELGMVDDIIKDKDNSRRRMLEQAAGITIYKTRKKEAKAKLEAAEQDINRIEDLLFEINNQLKALENQAKKAEKYFEIKKEYKDISVELAKASLQGFSDTYKDLNERQEEETTKRDTLDAEIETEEQNLEESRNSFTEKENALQTTQQHFNLLLQQLRTKENEKNLATQKLQYQLEREAGIKDFLQGAQGQLTSISESIEHTQQLADAENDNLYELQQRVHLAKIANDEKRVVFEEKRKENEVLRSQYQQLQRDQFAAEKKVAVADTGIINLQRSFAQISDEQQGRVMQLQHLEADIEEKQEVLEDKRSILQQLQEEQDRIKQSIAEAQAEMETTRSKLAGDTRVLDSKRNEYDLLKSLVDSMDGYPESVKFLHNNKNWNFRSPILSDIVYVHEEYRAAIENLLDSYLNYYIVHTPEEALQAIHLLDENKKGKANFFILNKLSDVRPKDVSQPGNTIAALDIIEVDDQYAKLAEYLLGNVFITENENAVSEEGAVFLHKSGRMVYGQYTLSGGSVGLFEGKKIGRAKNLEKLHEDIVFQDAVVQASQKEIKHLQGEIVAFQQQLKDTDIRFLHNEINQLVNAVFIIRSKIETIHASQQQSGQRLQEIDLRLQDEQEDIADTREALHLLNDRLQEMSARIEAAEQGSRAAEEDYRVASAQYNELNLQLMRQQSKVQTLKQELAYKQNQLHNLNTQIQSNTRQLEDSALLIGESKMLIEETDAFLIQLQADKETAEQEVNTANKEYYHLRNALQERESALRMKIKSRELSEQVIGQIKDKLNELKLQLAGMKERLQVEFKIVLDEILDQPRENNIPLEELQASTDRMKKRLENIGEINPTAIEAFIEMKKRYEFILDQKNDLLSAKTSLLQTIEEVETSANQQFLDTFNKVRDHFQQVFKALFTEEDTADLVLENPDNLAETSIDIIAKPKGKRPSSISQLSGGEKTLTATALLFSIYLIKPAPFCILDEVDAPLDDANVGKFTNMIKQFSNNSQFIIVTHNKTTMSTVDVIYGVTMQEPGVSKLVPVDFRNLN